jgi:hypothetical protein
MEAHAIDFDETSLWRQRLFDAMRRPGGEECEAREDKDDEGEKAADDRSDNQHERTSAAGNKTSVST